MYFGGIEHEIREADTVDVPISAFECLMSAGFRLYKYRNNIVRNKISFPIRLLVILCVVVIGDLVTSPAVANSKELDYCQRLRIELGDLKCVIERKKLLEFSILECPEDNLLLYYYAFNLARRQQYEKALHYYQLSAKQDNLFPYVYFGMGEVYLAMGNTVEAINIYKKGLAIHPDNKWGEMRLQEMIALNAQPDKPDIHDQDGGQTTPEALTSRDVDLEEIARQYHIKLDDLIRSRQQMASMKEIGNRYDIRINDLIRANKENSPSREVTQSAIPDSKNSFVADKNYLKDIADRYGVKLQAMKTLTEQMATIKNIAGKYGIPLSELMRPKNKTKISNNKHNPTDHTVLKDEDLSTIAKRYGVSLEDLVQTNKLSNPNKIFPGQVIKVPADTRR